MFSSCDLQCKKSDPQFWTHITQDLKLSPSQVLLIDDDPDNIACAAAFGLHTYLFSSSVEDIDFLKTL